MPAQTPRSFSRGEGYYRDGAVDYITRRGDTITAEVQGSDYEPYEVVVTLHPDGGIRSADCTCPYEQGGYCKHIVAVLLAVLRDQEEIAIKPDMETLLAGLTEAQLRRILRTMAEGNPDFADAVEQEVKWLKMEPAPGASPSAPAAISVDIAAIRREIRKDLRHLGASDHGYRAGYYYDDYFEVDPDPVLNPHLATIDALLAAGDPATAATVLTAVIEEWGEGISGLDEWISEGNEDTFAEATQELDTRLAEALLSQDISPEQREQWQARLDDWADDVVSLEIAAAAVEQGWDYPPLVAAMQGHITEQGAWGEERPFWADDFALVRLRVLERQGRTQEYINLAAAEGQIGLSAQMLARTGQVAQAVEEAIQFLTEPGRSSRWRKCSSNWASRPRRSRSPRMDSTRRSVCTRPSWPAGRWPWRSRPATRPWRCVRRRLHSSTATRWTTIRLPSAWRALPGRRSRAGCSPAWNNPPPTARSTSISTRTCSLRRWRRPTGPRSASISNG